MRKEQAFYSWMAQRMVVSALFAIASVPIFALGQQTKTPDSAIAANPVAIAAVDPTANPAAAQQEKPARKKAYVRNTFYGDRIIDNQTVMVALKGTLQFDLIHRFGTWNNGSSDLFGIFAGANIRFGMSYVPLTNLQVGIGINEYNMQMDGSAKYAILRQTKDDHIPISVTYYGLIAMDTRKKSPSIPIVTNSDRFNYFNQLLVARKINNALSLQVGIGLTHINNVPGYLDSADKVKPSLKNTSLTFCGSGKYNITPHTAIIVNYDQHLTQHPMNNPHPNLSAGLEMQTSGHTFQVFFGTYSYTLPTDNTVLNQNDYTKGQFLIGFNLSRLWNF
ncbi:MAG TPA: DUF5777 family beta-barrel protein [Puia sp.]|nr:DUF5777 family beta-barrel protein [Puia sp.]